MTITINLPSVMIYAQNNAGTLIYLFCSVLMYILVLWSYRKVNQLFIKRFSAAIFAGLFWPFVILGFGFDAFVDYLGDDA